MRSGFALGKIFGIEIRIDGSWVLIFLLISWNWATVLDQVHADWSGVLRWSIAVVAALLFFASVLAHEMAHSLVARSRGIPVSNIRLHLFGGVANLQREPDSPGSEFIMAVLGPVTSLVIGGALLLITRLVGGPRSATIESIAQTMGDFGPVMTIMAWLGSVNTALGLFNLIPGFPLDGGRVLRAALWALTGKLRLATRIASWPAWCVMGPDHCRYCQRLWPAHTTAWPAAVYGWPSSVGSCETPPRRATSRWSSVRRSKRSRYPT